MAQHDYDIANQSGSLFRSDLNSVLSAVVSGNSGAAEPSTKFAYMWWNDTTNGLRKQRNAANTSWIIRGSLHETRSVTESSGFTVGVDDYGKFYSVTGTTTATLTAAATLGSGFWFAARNSGSAVVTIDPNASETINANTTMVLMPGQGVFAWCDGSNWFALFFDQKGSAGQTILVGNQAEVLRIQTKVDDTGDCYLTFYDSSGSRKGSIGYTGSSSDNLVISSDENADMVFITNAAEVARFLSGGYLLVNLTSDSSAQFASRNTTAARSAVRGVNTASDGYCFVGYHNNDSHTTYVQYLLSDASAGSSWQFLSAVSDANGTPDQEFNLRGDGNGFCDGSFTGGGADFAEMCEWEDGNPNNEDRVGCSVTFVGDKIHIAKAGERVFGVVSGNPTIVGNAAWNKWSDKYLRDDFGRYMMEEYIVVEIVDRDGVARWVATDKIAGGIPFTARRQTQTRRKINPEWDPGRSYVSRSERQEWSAVARCGRVRLRKGQRTDPAWHKLRDISDTVEEWWI